MRHVELAPYRLNLSLQVSIKVFMWPDRFQINQADALIERVTQQVQLVCASKLEDTQRCQIALLALPDFGVLPDLIDGAIHAGGNIVVQLLVLPRKAPG